MGILFMLLLFAFAIIIHEAGHMLVARCMGAKVLAYSVGFGPKIWGRKIGGTEYKVCLIPFGGYVKIKGMIKLDEDTPDKDAVLMSNPECIAHDDGSKDSFANLSMPRKIAILVAGVTANLVCAFFLFTFAQMFGYDMPTNKVDPVKGKPAIAAGLKPGDRIVMMNGKDCKDFMDIVRSLKGYNGGPVPVTVERSGEKHSFTINPVKDKKLKRYIIGIKPAGETYHVGGKGVLEAAGDGGKLTVMLPYMFAKGLGMIFTGKVGRKDMSGPVGIVHIGTLVYKRGGQMFLYYCGVIMLALFFFNLLPIPILDGGHIMMLFVNKGLQLVRGRPLKFSTMMKVQFVFFWVLIALIIFITFGDIQRCASGFKLPGG